MAALAAVVGAFARTSPLSRHAGPLSRLLIQPFASTTSVRGSNRSTDRLTGFAVATHHRNGLTGRSVPCGNQAEKSMLARKPGYNEFMDRQTLHRR